MNWKIVTDSSCDIPPALIQKLLIPFEAAPLKIVVGEEEFVDIPSTNVGEMMDKMSAYKGASTSACPSPEEFANAFREADCVFCPTITGGLSGTYNCALRARDMVLEEYPDKKILVMDSHATSGVLLLLVQKAQELILNDTPFDTFVEIMEQYNQSLHILFTLSNFENLVKTGRMSKVAGVVATTLGIRALADNSPEGQIRVLEKVRGMEKATDRMIKMLPTYKSLEGCSMVISHCNNLEWANILKKALVSAYGPREITILETRCLTSFYAGRSGLLLSF